MDKMKKMAPDLMAKTDVLKALNRLAKQMMTQDVGMDDAEGEDQAEDGAIVADLSVKKVKPMMLDLDEEESEEEAPDAEGELDVSEEDEEDEDDMSMASLSKFLK